MLRPMSRPTEPAASAYAERDPHAPDVLHLLLDNHARFLAFLERRVGSREEAADILQEAFVRSIGRTDARRFAGSISTVSASAASLRRPGSRLETPACACTAPARRCVASSPGAAGPACPTAASTAAVASRGLVENLQGYSEVTCLFRSVIPSIIPAETAVAAGVPPPRRPHSNLLVLRRRVPLRGRGSSRGRVPLPLRLPALQIQPRHAQGASART